MLKKYANKIIHRNFEVTKKLELKDKDKTEARRIGQLGNCSHTGVLETENKNPVGKFSKTFKKICHN